MTHYTRRQFIRTAAAGIGAAGSGRFLASIASAQEKSKRPNIIFLLTDDQRWDTMGCMGNEIIQTPNMDAMAAQGVLFTNACVTTSICCTSRASIFLGQYARRHGINRFGQPFSDKQLQLTYPVQLRQAGYRTGFVGKYGLGHNKTIQAKQFDYWRGFGGQGKYEHLDEKGDYKHLTTIMQEQAVQFLRGCSGEQPFCLSVSFKAPHVQDGDERQFIYDPKLADMYKDVVIPGPEYGEDKYFEKYPDFFTTNNEGRKRWRLRFETSEKYQASMKGYYRLITGVDMTIGRIRSELQRLGFADNTVIVFSGDNGFFLGERGLAGKWYGHRESIRVPLIVYDPRLPAAKRGQRLSQMALNIDIAPTMLSLAGLAVPDAMQGENLLRLVHGEAGGWRQEFFYEHLISIPTIPKSEGVVTQRFKYLRYPETTPMFEELYDLQTDPHEISNLAGAPRLNPIRRKLIQKLENWIRQNEN